MVVIYSFWREFSIKIVCIGNSDIFVLRINKNKKNIFQDIKRIFLKLKISIFQLKQLHLQRIKLFGHEFKDLFMFSIYVIILYAIVLIDKNSLNIYSKKTVMDVMEGKFTRTQSFSGIKTISE